MKIGPVEIFWSPRKRVDQWRSELVRRNLMQLLSTDREIQDRIGRCARSEAKDFIQDWREIQLIEEKIGRGQKVSDGEMNFYNLHRADQAEQDRRRRDVNRHLTGDPA